MDLTHLVHIWPCAGQPVGGEEGLGQDGATLETSEENRLGILQPHLASEVPVKKASHPSQGRGSQVIELLPSQHF